MNRDRSKATDVEGGSPREQVVSASASAPKVSAPTAQEPQRYEPCDDALNYMQKDRMGDYVRYADYERTATALAAAQERIRQLEEGNGKLREFAKKIMEGWPEGGDLDGGYVQDAAEANGLLEPHKVSAPCGENCWCESMTRFPTTCYRPTPLLTGAPSTPSAAGEEKP